MRGLKMQYQTNPMVTNSNAPAAAKEYSVLRELLGEIFLSKAVMSSG